MGDFSELARLERDKRVINLDKYKIIDDPAPKPHDQAGLFRNWWDELYPQLEMENAVHLYVHTFPGRVEALIVELLG